MMERSVAIRKLGKMLGKEFGYRVDPKAPDQDGRDEARARLRELSPRRDALRKQMDERLSILLRNDAEYQALRAAHKELGKQCSDLGSMASCYRFTAGVSMGNLFFSVKAQGDSWEEVIAKLTK